jgi:hypothetical protein
VQSVCLQVPLVEPDQYAEPWAERRRAYLRALRANLAHDSAAAQAQT